MACNCIKRQKKLVEFFCKKPLSWACKKAQARLEKMEAQEKKL